MQEGLVYLIHLSEPMAHSQHYFGWTNQELPKRLQQHKTGRGARFLAVASERGIKLLLVRVFAGTRALERKFKNRKNARAYCPLCNSWDKVRQPKNI
jgi:predicted GIY-YIG superfamily endonuclease